MKSETWQGNITFSAKNLSKMTIGNNDTGKGLEQCFPTFFWFAAPLRNITDIWRYPWLDF